MVFDTKQEAYIEFRDIIRERTSAVVPWIGSGLSVPAGVPTWAGLRKALEKAAKDKITHLPADEAEPFRRIFAGIAAEANPWIAFRRLEEFVGQTTYRSTIRKALEGAENSPVPPAYTQLWQLGVSGMLNLNVDRLATRAHSELHPGKHLHEFEARDAGSSVRLLKNPYPFVANLHGVSQTASTWVFTIRELRGLPEVH